MSGLSYYVQIINKVGGLLSCIGSGYIVQDVLRSPFRRTESIYHRTMLGLSTTDIMSSFFTFILGSWPMPTGAYRWAAGNMVTCDIAAFIGLTGTMGSMIYNCSLATYYVLQLKYNLSDRRMRAIEKWLHIVPLSVALMFSITILSAKMLGPGIGHCWVALPYPWGCDAAGSEVECTRGVYNRRWYYLGIYLFNFLCIVYVSLAMYAVYKTVSDIEHNANRYSFISAFRGQNRKKSRKRSRRVMIQGILYSVTMILLWIFIATRIICFLITKRDNKGLMFTTATISPLQGFFNMIIYQIPVIRKKLKTRRKRKDDELKDSNGGNRTTSPIEVSFKNKENMANSGGDIEEWKIPVLHSPHSGSIKEEEKREIPALFAFQSGSVEEEEEREMPALFASQSGSVEEEEEREMPALFAFQSGSVEEEGNVVTDNHHRAVGGEDESDINCSDVSD